LLTHVTQTRTRHDHNGICVSDDLSHRVFCIATAILFAWPSATDAIAMIGNGIINAVGQYWWTRSLSLAPPSAVGPFCYFMLVWSAALGFIFWGDVPTFTLVAGSAIVVGSGLFLLWHETSRNPLAAD
jgi:drug/metabolite transporter (DMT)-like permease